MRQVRVIPGLFFIAFPKSVRKTEKNGIPVSTFPGSEGISQSFDFLRVFDLSITERGWSPNEVEQWGDSYMLSS